jgi:hypothetical protein
MNFTKRSTALSVPEKSQSGPTFSLDHVKATTTLVQGFLALKDSSQLRGELGYFRINALDKSRVVVSNEWFILHT